MKRIPYHDRGCILVTCQCGHEEPVFLRVVTDETTALEFWRTRLCLACAERKRAEREERAVSDGDAVQRLSGQIRVLSAIWDAIPAAGRIGTEGVWDAVRAQTPCSYEALILALCYLEAQGSLVREQAEGETFWRRRE